MSQITTLGICMVIFASASLAGEIAHYGACWGCAAFGSEDSLTSLGLGFLVSAGGTLAWIGARR